MGCDLNTSLKRLFLASLFSLIWLFPFFAFSEYITLGAIYSLSGYGAKAGRDEMDGMLLALEEINSSGGINGKRLKVVVEDNRSDPKSTVSAFNKLVSINKIPVLIGPNWAEFSSVVAPLAQRKKVVMLTASGYTKDLVQGRDYVFSTFGKHEWQVQPLAEYIIRQRHKKIAVLKSTNAYFVSMADALTSLLAKSGVKVNDDISIPSPHMDFRSTILQLKSKAIDAAIAFLLEGGDISSFLKQSTALRAGYRRYSVDIAYTEELAKNPSLAEGVVFIRYVSSANKEFRNKFQKRYGREPSIGSGETYDNVYLIKWAIEKCGEKPEEIKECLLNADYKGVCGKITFDKDGLISAKRRYTELYTVKDGKVVRLREE